MYMNILFQCELCKTVYETKQAARICETHNPLPVCDVQVGDVVPIQTRYSGTQKDTVQEIIIHCVYGNALKSWIPKGKRGIQEFLILIGKTNIHEYAIRTTKKWQIGKDYYSNIISLSTIYN